MASNAFGKIFRITTWGESHGTAIGVVIDGCPAGLALSVQDINEALAYRMPGRNAYMTPRKETDQAEICGGVFEGVTTGAPVSIVIKNQDADSSKYEPIKHLARPGHANLTYLAKYGVYDYRGGGRASARETACRVAAGAVAKKLLQRNNIQLCAYVTTIGAIDVSTDQGEIKALIQSTLSSPIFCPDKQQSEKMMQYLNDIKSLGDSVGGIVTFIADSVPVGLGDPMYEKLEANLAKAMLTIPASKGFEIGDGFQAARMKGSEHNDLPIHLTQMYTNHAGGILGGISNGMRITGRVAFKPTSSIQHVQPTIDIQGKPAVFQLPEGSRHDPCVAIRAVPVVEAMLALVLADALLMNRCVQ